MFYYKSEPKTYAATEEIHNFGQMYDGQTQKN